MTHPTTTTDDTVTVTLADDVPEHILVDGDALCGLPYHGDTRLVDAGVGPLADASLHVCTECFDAWHTLDETPTLTPTIQCHCECIEDNGTVYYCGATETHEAARVVSHPNAASNAVYMPSTPTDDCLPVCQHCYMWLSTRPDTDLPPYSTAKSWAAHQADAQPASSSE